MEQDLSTYFYTSTFWQEERLAEYWQDQQDQYWQDQMGNPQ